MFSVYYILAIGKRPGNRIFSQYTIRHLQFDIFIIEGKTGLWIGLMNLITFLIDSRLALESHLHHSFTTSSSAPPTKPPLM